MRIKLALAILLLFGFFAPSFSQDSLVIENNAPELKLQDSDSLLFYRNLDSIMNLWYVKHAEMVKYKPTSALKDSTIPTFSDSVYMDRIAKLNSIIDLAYNDKVRAFIEMYSTKKRDQVENMLGLSEYYFLVSRQVAGKSSAIVAGGPRPGKTPTAVPRIAPTSP